MNRLIQIQRAFAFMFLACMLSTDVVAQKLVSASPNTDSAQSEEMDVFSTVPPMSVNHDFGTVRSHVVPRQMIGESDDTGTLLYGIVEDAEDLITHGMYSFHAVDPIHFTEECIAQAYGNFGTYGEGKYYTMVVENSNSYYYTYDANTWEVLDCVVKTSSDANNATSLAFDPVTEQVYGIVKTTSGRVPKYSLVIFDTETWNYEILGQSSSLYAIAFDGKGDLYGFDSSGNLNKFDKNTGAITAIGPTGVAPAFAQSAAYDPVSDKFYWASFTSSYKSVLYTVDLSYGELTEVAQVPGVIEILGMYVKTPLAEDKAPASLSDVEVVYPEPGGLEGKFNFKVPTTHFDGTSMTGNVDVLLMVGTDTIARKSFAPGTEGSFSYSFPERGKYTAYIRAINDEGRGPRNTIRTYAGIDEPDMPLDINLTIDDSHNAVLTWSAPESTQHGGYLDTEALTYDIVRYPDMVEVAKDLKGTTFSENVGSVLKNYSYSVTAKVGEIVGSTGMSNYVRHGEALAMPYLETFDNQYNFPLFTIIDANQDGNMWKYMSGGYAQYSPTSSGSDDWLITPPLKMDNMHVYKMRYLAQGSWTFPQDIDVTIGAGATVDAQKQTVMSFREFITSGYEPQQTYFIPEESGELNIGIHVTNATQSLLNLDSLQVVEFASVLGPDSVNNVKLTSVADELKTTISFTVPVCDIAGNKISSVDAVKIYRGDELIHTSGKLNAGSNYEFVDENGVAGINSYRIVPVNSYGDGWSVEFTRYLGYDTPQTVSNLVAVWGSNSYEAKLSWEAPTVGIHGGNINSSSLTYKIKYSGNGSFDKKDLVSGLEECSYVADMSEMISGTQKSQEFYVIPVTEAGEGELSTATLPMGVFCTTPYKESFVNMTYTNGKWNFENIIGSNSWYLEGGTFDSNVQPYDDDGGMLLFCNRYSFGVATGETMTRMKTPAINLSGLDEPVLSFWMCQSTLLSKDTYLIIEATTNGRDYFNLSDTIFGNSGNGWKEYRIPLDGYKGLEMFGLAFKGHAPSQSEYFYIDLVRIDNYLQHDIAVSSFVASPSIVKAGNNAHLVASVINKGYEVASGYKVDLYYNDEIIESKEGSDISSEEVAEIVFEVPVNAAQAGDSHEFFAVINYDKDENETNDISKSATVYVESDAFLPVPTGLSATISGSAVNLTYNAPETIDGPQTVTDSFDNYTSFAISGYGEWKVYDADKQEVLTAGDSNDYPNKGYPSAFQVFNPEKAGVSSDATWDSYSGGQYLVAWGGIGYYIGSYDKHDAVSDDWLISPQVCGGTELSLYAKAVVLGYGEGSFEIWTSSTGQNVEDFTKLASQSLDTDQWTQYSYTLPENTLYFAIRFVSSETFAMMLDDVTYTRAKETMILKGYNIYRNGDLIAQVSDMEQSYLDEDVSKRTYIYNVSAVYEKGESELSEDAFVDLTNVGIDETDSEASLRINDNTVTVSGIEGRSMHIYSVDGMCVFAKDNCAEYENVTLQDGSYILSLDNLNNTKFIIR